MTLLKPPAHVTAALAVVAFALYAPATARADNSSDAIAELKQGYALKQAGNCRDALVHFTLSFALDPKPKALLNRADCEAQSGDLVAAQGHAAQGLQLARQANDAELATVAQGKLTAIEAKLPHLTLGLHPGAPAGSAIARDGGPVDAALLGVAVALNPGKHRLLVTAPGYAERTFEVTLAEGANRSIEVLPGAKLEVAPTPTATATETTSPSPLPEMWPRTPLLYTALGVGGVGVVLGLGAGLAANAKHSTLQGECNNSTNTCAPQYAGELNSFNSLRTWSTVGYVAGVLGVAGGVTLWLTAPKTQATTAGVWFGPAAAGIVGSF
jgi:tetratricopeptide (TPR) repeat protein